MARFPDVRALAAAPVDEVLHLWSGLGYYARARNLHRAAIRIRDELRRRVPRELRGSSPHLPGIGRSTAGAILALARGASASRFSTATRGACWRATSAWREDAAERRSRSGCGSSPERCTPATEVAAYTQAIMDLGATRVRAAPAAVPAVPAAARLRRAPQRPAARAAGAAPWRRAPPAQRASWWSRCRTTARCCSSADRTAACGAGCGACRSSATATAAGAFMRDSLRAADGRAAIAGAARARLHAL